jgi:hypothetical protein
MLPFMDSKKTASSIISMRNGKSTDTASEVDHSSDQDPGLSACAEDLLHAIQTKSVSGIADALKAAFQCLDSGQDENEGGEYDAKDES